MFSDYEKGLPACCIKQSTGHRYDLSDGSDIRHFIGSGRFYLAKHEYPWAAHCGHVNHVIHLQGKASRRVTCQQGGYEIDSISGWLPYPHGPEDQDACCVSHIHGLADIEFFEAFSHRDGLRQVYCRFVGIYPGFLNITHHKNAPWAQFLEDARNLGGDAHLLVFLFEFILNLFKGFTRYVNLGYEWHTNVAVSRN